MVRVGQGDIEDRLRSHRIDTDITKYAGLNQETPLLVTWASVTPQHRDGVERYLADTLKPLEGRRYPNVLPTRIVLPWPWS